MGNPIGKWSACVHIPLTNKSSTSCSVHALYGRSRGRERCRKCRHEIELMALGHGSRPWVHTAGSVRTTSEVVIKSLTSLVAGPDVVDYCGSAHIVHTLEMMRPICESGHTDAKMCTRQWTKQPCSHNPLRTASPRYLLVHIEKYVAAAIPLILNGGLLCPGHRQVVVREPGLLLDIIYVADVVP